jgi:hypothetical protein
LIVVLYPRACNSFAKDAAIIPFPKEEVTPPVTKNIFRLVHAVVVCIVVVSKLGKNTIIN